MTVRILPTLPRLKIQRRMFLFLLREMKSVLIKFDVMEGAEF